MTWMVIHQIAAILFDTLILVLTHDAYTVLLIKST